MSGGDDIPNVSGASARGLRECDAAVGGCCSADGERSDEGIVGGETAVVIGIEAAGDGGASGGGERADVNEARAGGGVLSDELKSVGAGDAGGAECRRVLQVSD